MSDPTPGYTVPPDIAASPAWCRLEDQRRYFSAQAALFQRRYHGIKLGLIGLSASIPLVAFLPGDAGRYIVALSGVAIALLEGVLLLKQYGPQGVKYRVSSEKLKRERALMLCAAEDYAGKPLADQLRLLAERVESVVGEENRQWLEAQQKALEALAQTQAWTRAQLQAVTAMAARLPADPGVAPSPAAAAAAAAAAAPGDPAAAAAAAPTGAPAGAPATPPVTLPANPPTNLSTNPSTNPPAAEPVPEAAPAPDAAPAEAPRVPPGV